MKRTLLGLLMICLVLAVLLAVAGCGEGESVTTVSESPADSGELSSTTSTPASETAGSEAPKSIKVGFLSEVTGPIATMGARAMWSWQAAIDDINADGGMYVKQYDTKIPIEVVEADLQGDTANGDPQAQWLCDQGVTAILASTSAIPGAAGVAEKRQIPLLLNATSSRQVFDHGYTYIFTLAGLGDLQSRQVVDFLNWLPEEKKPTVIASLKGSNVMSTETAGYLDPLVAEAGYELLSVPFTVHATDLSAQILEMKKGSADFICGAMQPPDGILLMKQMKQLDYNVKGMILTVCVQDVVAWSSQGPDGEYVMGWANTDRSFTYPGMQDLVARYEAAFDESYFESAATGYACVEVLANAITTVGSLDPVQIRDAIAATDMMTISGPVKFDTDGTSDRTLVLWQWQDGETEVVWPTDVATAELVYPMPGWGER